MKVYKLTKYNRRSGEAVEVLYATKERAEKEQAEIKTIYEEAEEKGVGLHWDKVVWEEKAYIKEVEVIE